MTIKTIKLNIPPGFLEPEVRDDYYIGAEIKKMWAVQLDLIMELDRVCQKHGIRYSAYAGTLLGVIRHKGYIPWDDDIDFMMTRSEYNRLCEVAKDEFKAPYFWQTEYTDRGSLRGHAQLRNSETTCLLDTEYPYKRKYNQGIFIDIFPFDGVPDDPDEYQKLKDDAERLQQQMTIRASFEENYCDEAETAGKSFVKKAMHLLMSSPIHYAVNYDNIYRTYEATLARYSDTPTKKLAMFPKGFRKDTDRYYPVEDFETTQYMPFEFIKIPVIAGYDRFLRLTYGNYMRKVREKSVHGGMFCDTERPYTYYTEQIRRIPDTFPHVYRIAQLTKKASASGGEGSAAGTATVKGRLTGLEKDSRRTIFFYIDLSSICFHGEEVNRKLKAVLPTFEAHKEQVRILFWMNPILHVFEPNIDLAVMKEFYALRDAFISSGCGEYSEDPDVDTAIAQSDAYYGDNNLRITEAFRYFGKPMMLIDYDLL